MPKPILAVRAATRSNRTPWLLLAGLAGLAAVWHWLGPAGAGTRGASGAGPKRAALKERTVHYVTPRQWLASNDMADKAVGGVAGTDQDGKAWDWAALSGGGPVVLVFLKEGCPCNAEFEPFFQRVERLYRGRVRFAAVIDAGVEAARAYADEMRVAHPVLADPDRALIRRFGAENGGYVALLTADATVDGLWPGCSADGLRELGRRAARLAGVDARELDTSGMSRPWITGCPYGP